MPENYSDNVQTPDFGSSPLVEQMSIAQRDPSDFFAMIGSIELTQTQLIACLAAILFAVFVAAWYWDYMLYSVSHGVQTIVAWFQQLTGLGAPALDGGSNQIVYHQQPVAPIARCEAATHEQSSEMAIEESGEETTLVETTDFYNHEPPEESEWCQESASADQTGIACLADVDASHQNVAEHVANSDWLKNQFRSELEVGQQSLELKIAELAKLDEQLTLVSDDLASKSDSVADLEVKNSDLQTLVDSLQKKLGVVDSELEKQSEQNVTLESQIKAAKDESIELVEQASRAGLLDEKISVLTQELSDRNSELAQLKLVSTEAQESATTNSKLLQQTERRGQELAEQLAESKQAERQVRADFESAQKSIDSLTSDLAQAEQQVASQEEATKRLVEEKAELKSKLEESDAQLTKVVAESDKVSAESKKLTDSRMALEAQLKSEQDLFTRTKGEFDSATLEIAELRKEISSAQSALTQNAHDHAKAAELLQAKLDDAMSSAVLAESQHKDVYSQLESKLFESADELNSLRDEAERLKSELKGLSETAAEAGSLREQLASKTMELEALAAMQTERETKLKETETQVATFEKQARNTEYELSETLELLSREQTLAAELKKQVNDKLAENAQLTARLGGHSELVASFESLSLRYKELDRNLAQAFTELEQGQQLNVRLHEDIAGRDDQLSSQTARCTELEEQAKTLQQQTEEAERKLTALTKERQQEISLRSQLEETNQRLSSDLDRQSNECANLEKQLAQVSQDRTDSSIIELKFGQQQQELADLKIAFDKEGTQRAELFQVLDAKRAHIEELEKQVSTATENQQHIDKLLNKVRKYKFAHAKNKELLEQVVAKSKSNYTQGLGYLNVAKSLRSELNAQRKISVDLQQKLDAAGGNSSNRLDQAQLDLLVGKAARTQLLSLKSQFEERLSEKNRIICELRDRISTDPNFD